jgi:uncharacterized protein with gpF-like domain
MKYTYTFAAALLVLFAIQACTPKAGKQVQQQIDNTPSWFLNPPADTDEYLYATGSFTSARRNIAQTRAMLQANTNMAVKLGTVIENLQEDFLEEITSGERSNYMDAFSNATRQITNQELVGVSQDRIEFVARDNGQYEAFILARIPVGAAKSALINALSNDEEMYVRFQRSNAFERMDEALKRSGQRGN